MANSNADSRLLLGATLSTLPSGLKPQRGNHCLALTPCKHNAQARSLTHTKTTHAQLTRRTPSWI
eukprot:2595091-Alexandrium_andersonii.AAC.1